MALLVHKKQVIVVIYSDLVCNADPRVFAESFLHFVIITSYCTGAQKDNQCDLRVLDLNFIPFPFTTITEFLKSLKSHQSKKAK